VPQDAPAAFFSYCREDSDFALRLAEDLKAAGASVWLDQLDIVPGQRWDRAVEDALANCPRMLVILSPASVDSTNVMDEVSFALEEKKTVIPIIYKDCTVPFRLRRVQYVDFRRDYNRGLKELLKILAPEQKAAQSAPAISDVPSHRQTVVTEADEREHAAAEERRKAAEAEQAAERSRLEQERRRATEQARLEDAARKAAEQTRLEEERKRAAERARVEEERRKAEEQARREKERKQAAEQARLKEQHKQAAERARVEEQKAAEHRDLEAELERQRVPADEQRQRVEQEDTPKSVFWRWRVYSKLPVWARIGVASCGILIASSVLYWVSRQPSHRQTGGNSQQQFKTESPPSSDAIEDKSFIPSTADSRSNGKSPRPSNPPPVITPSGAAVGDKSIISPATDGGRGSQIYVESWACDFAVGLGSGMEWYHPAHRGRWTHLAKTGQRHYGKSLLRDFRDAAVGLGSGKRGHHPAHGGRWTQLAKAGQHRHRSLLNNFCDAAVGLGSGKHHVAHRGRWAQLAKAG
jgi:hypothetical protein